MEKKFIFLIIFLTLIGMTVVSAANTTDSDNGYTNTLKTGDNNIINEDIIQNTKEDMKIDSNIKTDYNKTKSLEQKMINKQRSSNTKSATERTVYNSEDLEQAIREGINVIHMRGDDSDYTTPKFVNSKYRSNITVYGNGITIDGTLGDPSGTTQTYIQIDTETYFTIRDVTFKNFNFQDGIISSYGEDNVVNIINCTFTNNIMPSSALVKFGDYNTVNITNSTFVDNVGTAGTAVEFGQYGTFIINGTKFINNQVQSGLKGPIKTAYNGNLNMSNSIFDKNYHANFEVKQDDTSGENYIELINNDNYIKNIQKYELFIDDDDTARYEGISISEYRFTDYTTLRLVVTATDHNKYYNNTYLFKAPAKPPKTYEVSNYDQLAQAIDEAKTVAETKIIITLIPGGNYIATTSMIWGNTSNDGTELPTAQPKTVIINGNGTVLDGNNNFQFMAIQRYYNLTIANITLCNYTAIEGGAFNLSDETLLNVTNVTFISNNAEKGGAIYAMGIPFINNSVFINNTANIGGDFYKHGATWFNITNTNFTGTNPSKIQMFKQDDDFKLNISTEDYDVPFNSQILILENGVSKGVYTLDNYIISGYTVPDGKNEIEVIIYSQYVNQFDNNRYKLFTEIKEFNVETTIINDTLGNVKINVTVKDDNNQPIQQQEVNMTLPDGSILTETTDENGNVTFKPQLYLGTHTLEITIIGEENYHNYYNTIDVEVKAIPTNTKIETLNSIVNNVTINVTVSDSNGELVDKGIIIITDENGEYITAGIIKYKEAIIKLDLPAGRTNIIAIYPGNNTHITSNTTKELNILHQAEIQVEILNNTETNVTAKITVTNEEKTPITDELEIILPNGSTIYDHADNTGNLEIKDTTVTSGRKTLTVTLPDTTDTKGMTITVPITVLPDYMKIIAEMNETIQELNDTINELNNTVRDQNSTINSLNDTVNDLNNTVQNQNNTINDMNSTINSLNDTVNDLNNTVQDQNNIINNLNDTVNDLNNTVQDQNNTINNLNDTVNNLNDTVNDLNNTVQNQNNTINSMNDTINNLNNTVQDQNDTINNMNSTINGLNDTVNDLNNTVQDQNNIINNLNDTVNDLNNTVQDQNDTINNMNSTINGLNDTVNDLNNTVQDQNNIINNLNDTVNDLNNTVQDQNDTINNMNDTINGLNDTVNDLNNTVQDQNNTINNMNDTLNDLNNTVQNQNDTINTMNDTINNLNNTVHDQNNVIKDLKELIDKIYAPKNTTIIFNEITDAKYNSNVTIRGSLVTEDGIGLFNQNITLTIGETVVNLTTNGVFEYTTTFKEMGEKTVTVTYAGTDKYKASEATTTFNVEKQDIVITYDPIADVKYDDNVTITGKFTEITGKVISNSNVNVYINGKQYKLRTDKTGSFTLSVEAKKMGINNVTLSYGGNFCYNSYYTNTTFNVEKQDIIITYDPIADIKYDDNVTITGKFTEMNGKVISNSNVNVYINGKQYKARTDKNGTFTLSVEVKKMGINNVTLSYGGNFCYNSYYINTTFNVEKQDIIITYDPIADVKYDDNVTITGKFTEMNGKVISNSNVNVYINGKQYKARTDKNGTFTQTVQAKTLGTNNVTLTYGGNTCYNSYQTSTTFDVIAKTE